MVSMYGARNYIQKTLKSRVDLLLYDYRMTFEQGLIYLLSNFLIFEARKD